MPDCSRIDPLVTPFVDAELSRDEQRTMAAHLSECPSCRTRVAAERAVRVLLHSRRTDLTPPAAPPALKVRCAGFLTTRSALVVQLPETATADRVSAVSSWRRRYAPFALAATLLLAVGGASIYQATRSSSRVLAAELTLDHEKCFRLNHVLGTRHSAETVQAALVSWFGWRVDLPDLAGHDDVSLVGSRPCLYGEGKIAHIMYTHNGQPVSLFMLPREARQDQLLQVFGHQCRIWSEGDRTFVLVARESPHEMEQMAALVRTTIR